MKKVLFSFMVFILISCTPQVTVTSEVTVTLAPPTETPIPIQIPLPTSTLDPEFIVWRAIIRSSGGRFILTSDGTIQDNGVAVDGLHVDENGIMTLTINDKVIILTSNDITFSENGIEIEGYDFNESTDEWVELTPEQKLDFDMDLLKLSIDKYSIGYNQDGIIEMRDIGSNKLVYKAGEWARDRIVEFVIMSNNCQATDFPLTTGANSSNVEGFSEYRSSMFKQVPHPDNTGGNVYPIYQAVYFKGTLNCWGLWIGINGNEPFRLAWTKLDGTVVWVDTFDPNLE